ncbi:putative nuclease HARBI1 [Haliotis asinina]|uniref:putative nuclease HARBI1 n=1 Tax=Haliotis asinina TaxID=109174 RepID=UPI0035320CDB
MAAASVFYNEIERSLRKQRVYRDRTSQLDMLNDFELISRYRLSREAIIALVEKTEPVIGRATQRSCAISAECQVLLTLRYLGKGGFLSEIGDLHGLDKSTVSRSLHNTASAFCTILNNVHFPWRPKDQMAVKDGFHKVCGLPKVLGATDGTLIPIKRPPIAEEAGFICRKGYHAVNVQAICDSSLRFTNVVVKWLGSTHDSLIWSNCKIASKMEEHVPDGWLLGDSGYACRPWLLTPFTEPKTHPQERYNTAHIRTRNTTERAFGVLKARFRCLHKSSGCLWFSPERCTVIIMACFKLHNYCINNGVHVPPGDALAEADVENNTPPTLMQCVDGNTARQNLVNERFS